MLGELETYKFRMGDSEGCSLPFGVAALVSSPTKPLSKREQFVNHAVNAASGKDNVLAAQKLPVVKEVTLKPKYRLTAQRKKIRWGPIKLPVNNGPKPKGRTMDPNGFAWSGGIDGVPKDASILMAQGQLVNEDSSPAGINTGTYIHHTVTMDSDSTLHPSGGFCDSERTASLPGGEFIGWGQESNEDGVWMFTTQDGKLNNGWYCGPRASMSVNGELVNYSNVSKNIYLDLDIEYVQGKPAGLMDAHIQLVNIKGCRGAAGFKPPKGFEDKPWNMTGPKMKIGQDAYLFQQKGHVHDGGESMTVSINGKIVCRSAAKYGGKLGTMSDANGKPVWQTIDAMGQCFGLIPLHKGDEVVLTAFYDSSNHKLRATHGHGGMGNQEQEEMGMMTWYMAAKPPNVPWVNIKEFSSALKEQKVSRVKS